MNINVRFLGITVVIHFFVFVTLTLDGMGTAPEIRLFKCINKCSWFI